MFHVTWPTRATAVTVTPPAEADASTGPVESALGSTHIHTGSPTSPLAEFGGGAMPMFGALRAMDAIACCARRRGSTVGAPGASGPSRRKIRPVHTPNPSPAGRGQVKT